MTSLKKEYKRSQPLLGTFFSISLNAPLGVGVAAVVADAYAEAHRLEKVFSLRLPESDICRFNKASDQSPVEVRPELFYLSQLSETIWRRSEGGFNPFSLQNISLQERIIRYTIDGGRFFIAKTTGYERVAIDLNGIAKGFIVDRTVGVLERGLPAASGLVNAGGDLRFFNTPKRCLHVRLGAPKSRLARALLSERDSVATSSPSVAVSDEQSTTVYTGDLRKPLTVDHTAVVMANCTAIADSLAKVALFGRSEAVSNCALSFGAKVLVFDADGRLTEEYGAA